MEIPFQGDPPEIKLGGLLIGGRRDRVMHKTNVRHPSRTVLENNPKGHQPRRHSRWMPFLEAT